MARLTAFVAEADAKISSAIESERPANRDSPSCRNRHLASVVAPGVMLVVAIAPGLTIGFVLPSGWSSMAESALNRRPVALAPTNSSTGGRRVDGAHEGEQERLGHAHDRELDVGVTRLDRRPVDAGDADPELLGIHGGQGRVDLGQLAGGVLPEAPVRPFDQVADPLARSEMPCRDIRSGIAKRSSHCEVLPSSAGCLDSGTHG